MTALKLRLVRSRNSKQIVNDGASFSGFRSWTAWCQVCLPGCKIRFLGFPLIDLPLNYVPQLSKMNSIVENVCCFHHVELRAVMIVRERLRTAQATVVTRLWMEKETMGKWDPPEHRSWLSDCQRESGWVKIRRAHNWALSSYALPQNSQQSWRAKRNTYRAAKTV